MSEFKSTRDEIIKILCDTSVFKQDFEGYLRDIAPKVILALPEGVESKVKNINSSIGEALETLDGYVYWDGSVCHSKRKISSLKDDKGHNYYTFGEVVTLN